MGTGNCIPAIGSDGALYAGGSGLHAFHNQGTGRPTVFRLAPRVFVPNADPVEISDTVQAGEVVNLIVVGVWSGAGVKHDVQKVEFYLDVDNDGAITEADGSSLVGTDEDGVPWDADVDTTDFEAGSYTFLARAIDFADVPSNVISTTFTVVDAP